MPAQMLERINVFTETPTNTINNMYELPSIERAVRYLHGAAGFPTEATWLKAIRNGTFISWTLINVKKVNKIFLESEETQKGHMRNIHKNALHNKDYQEEEDSTNSRCHTFAIH